VRLVKIRAPEGNADKVAEVAFRVGIKQVSIHQEQTLKANKSKETKDVIDIAAATPEAKAFMDTLTAEPFFDPSQYSINVRQPRSILLSENLASLTWPVVEPSLDIYEELWQFSHITYSFVGRVFIAGSLVAYGMIEDKLLIMLAGLLFVPFLPLLLAVGFGALIREWRLTKQGALAFIVGVALLMGAGAAITLMVDKPVSYNESNTLIVSLLVSLAIGVAATLAICDDVGKREIIGLAASAQVAIIPVWFGISFVRGFPAATSSPASERAITFLVNVAAIIAASLCAFAALRARGEGLRRFRANAKAKRD
jgi:uncharacterized protein DUF389